MAQPDKTEIFVINVKLGDTNHRQVMKLAYPVQMVHFQISLVVILLKYVRNVHYFHTQHWAKIAHVTLAGLWEMMAIVINVWLANINPNKVIFNVLIVHKEHIQHPLVLLI